MTSWLQNIAYDGFQYVKLWLFVMVDSTLQFDGPTINLSHTYPLAQVQVSLPNGAGFPGLRFWGDPSPPKRSTIRWVLAFWCRTSCTKKSWNHLQCMDWGTPFWYFWTAISFWTSLASKEGKKRCEQCLDQECVTLCCSFGFRKVWVTIPPSWFTYCGMWRCILPRIRGFYPQLSLNSLLAASCLWKVWI